MAQSKKHNHNIIIGLVAVVLGILILVGMSVFVALGGTKEKEQATNGSISVVGTVTCLPHKNTDGAQTMECALGIKDEQGNYYGLSDPKGKMTTTSTEGSIKVTGTLSATKNETYQSAGTIDIIAIETAQ